VILVNIVGSSFLIIILGFKAAGARKDCILKAEKDGDEHAAERFSYPKLYAEGFSAQARVFNCIQRSHQQALETYPQFLALSLIAGYKFPLSCTVGGLYWMYARWMVGFDRFNIT
jgi:glutathione S-transferase